MDRAGYSAQKRAWQARDYGAWLQRMYHEAYRTASRYQAAAEAEREVAARLITLMDRGWHLLVDRQWPGTRAGNVDMLLAGPGGVFIVDVKNWRRPPEIITGRLCTGNRDAHDEVDKLVSVTHLAEEALSCLGMSPVAVTPLMVFTRRRVDALLGPVRLVGVQNVLTVILEQPPRMAPSEVAAAANRLAEFFPAYDSPRSSDADADASGVASAAGGRKSGGHGGNSGYGRRRGDPGGREGSGYGGNSDRSGGDDSDGDPGGREEGGYGYAASGGGDNAGNRGGGGWDGYAGGEAGGRGDGDGDDGGNRGGRVPPAVSGGGRVGAAVPTMSTVSTPALFEVEELHDAAVRAAMAGPVERWMTFLHPSQAALVRRDWQGPARISGAAGTGKTVVGLHRAAYLAQRSDGPLLYVTFVRNLPRVHGEFLRKINSVVADKVEFTSLHGWACAFLARRGVNVRLNSDTVKAVFGRAWLNVGANGLLGTIEPNPHYWWQELDHVIKGRGVETLASYLGVPRHGRRTALRREHRAAAWELYQEYERVRADQGVHDFNDVLMLALHEVGREPVDPAYGAVIVDEVQDLTLVGLRLVHALAGNTRNRLLLIGDGQQAVYPGGFRLPEAGIMIQGRRNEVLRVNYRNAAEIWQAALAVVADDSFVDLDGPVLAGRRDVDTNYGGGVVDRVTETTSAAHDEALVTALSRFTAVGAPDTLDIVRDEIDVVLVDAAAATGGLDLDSGGRRVPTPLGDCALLCPTNREVERYEKLLASRGIPTLRLEEYDGRPAPAVKIGTYLRAKGLEFKHVFLPRYDTGVRTSAPDDSAGAEHATLRRRQLFVAMTRARDTLWLGSVSASPQRQTTTPKYPGTIGVI